MIASSWTTPNGRKVLICLEEAGLPYRPCPVNISEGEQFAPRSLAISPDARENARAILLGQGAGRSVRRDSPRLR